MVVLYLSRKNSASNPFRMTQLHFLFGSRGIPERSTLLGLNPHSDHLASRLISGIHVTCSSYRLLGNKLSAFTCRGEQRFGQTAKPNRTEPIGSMKAVQLVRFRFSNFVIYAVRFGPYFFDENQTEPTDTHPYSHAQGRL